MLPAINHLNELAHDQADASKITPLRQQILEKVVAASLQVDATIAQIDNEIAQSNEVRGYLSDKRDKAVNRANLLSLVSAGFGSNQRGASVAFRREQSFVYRRHRRRSWSPPVWRSPVFGRRKAEPDYSTSTRICWPNCSIGRRSAIAAMTQLSGAFSTTWPQQTRKVSRGRSASFRPGLRSSEQTRLPLQRARQNRSGGQSAFR